MALVSPDDLRANVQAQSQTISTGGHGMTPEWLEDLHEAFRRYGLTGVPHLQHQVMLISSRTDFDGAAGPPMRQGVP